MGSESLEGNATDLWQYTHYASNGVECQRSGTYAVLGERNSDGRREDEWESRTLHTYIMQEGHIACENDGPSVIIIGFLIDFWSDAHRHVVGVQANAEMSPVQRSVHAFPLSASGDDVSAGRHDTTEDLRG
ncbi:hypothetical protein OSTOST_23276 [Ostertagia ostertagi]